MNTIHINTSQPYDALIGRGILKNCGELISNITNRCCAAVITDTNVNALYSDIVLDSLTAAGFDICLYVFPAGEQSKTIDTYAKILSFLAENHLTRTDLVVALGGGVVGDIAGFAAATYMRGVRFIQMPTTLLAATDASVGGKTAVDLPSGKNLAGAFLQPSLVICDCDCFDTLSDGQMADGIAESIKHGLIADKKFFDQFCAGGAMQDIVSVVSRNVEIKRSFVVGDERDHSKRQMLNFGHTIGHAIERCSGYTISHGHAVAIGMAAALHGAASMGFGRPDILERLLRALGNYSLPSVCPFDFETIYKVAVGDKKRDRDKMNVVFIKEVGQAFTLPLTLDDFRNFIKAGIGRDSYGH